MGDLTLKDWGRSLRGVQEAACFALDDPLPFLLMGVADCCQLYRWARVRREARKQGSVKSTESEVYRLRKEWEHPL